MNDLQEQFNVRNKFLGKYNNYTFLSLVHFIVINIFLSQILLLFIKRKKNYNNKYRIAEI